MPKARFGVLMLDSSVAAMSAGGRLTLYLDGLNLPTNPDASQVHCVENI